MRRDRWSGGEVGELDVWVVEARSHGKAGDASKTEIWYAPDLRTWVYKHDVHEFAGASVPFLSLKGQHRQERTVELTALPSSMSA